MSAMGCLLLEIPNSEDWVTSTALKVDQHAWELLAVRLGVKTVDDAPAGFVVKNLHEAGLLVGVNSFIFEVEPAIGPKGERRFAYAGGCIFHVEFSGASCSMPRVILGPRRMPPAASGSWRHPAIGRVPSRGGLPESSCAAALFPFSSPLSSLILNVYLPFYVYDNSHIKILQHISQNILTRKQFLGTRRLFEERRKDRSKKSGWTTIFLLIRGPNGRPSRPSPRTDKH
jgi:hypothetical protein